MAKTKEIYKRVFGNNARTVLLRKNIFANFVLKACTGIITLLLVPLTLKCLDAYTNGVWLTISSSLLLFDNLDIGLGNGLRNKLAEYLAKSDYENARKAVSSTVVLLACIIIPVMLLLLLLCYTCDIYGMLNVAVDVVPNLRNVVAVCVVLFCSTFIMKFMGNVYLGLQMPAVSNLLATGGYPLILLGTYLMYISGVHSIMYIAALNLSVPLLMYVLAYPYTFFVRYPHLRPSVHLFSSRMSGGLFSMGVLFFLNQVASTMVMFSSNILISRWFDPSLVTSYQIVYRYFAIPLLVFMVINAPNWSATTDALYRGDMEWIANSAKRMNKILLLFLVLIMVMIALSQPVYNIWIGGQVKIPMELTVAMSLYIYMMMCCLAFCYYLNGMGVLKLQLICTLVGVVAYFIVSYILYRLTNSTMSVCLGMVISLVPSAIFNRMQFYKILKGTAKGIWRK